MSTQFLGNLSLVQRMILDRMVKEAEQSVLNLQLSGSSQEDFAHYALQGVQARTRLIVLQEVLSRLSEPAPQQDSQT